MTQQRILAARRRPTVAGEVRLHLRGMIVEGRLAPGHPLSENEVAAELGLSRTPVREAFIKLEEEGLIDIYPQYGSFVAPIRVADVHDSQFIRESLECAALAKSVEHHGAGDLAALQALLDRQSLHLTGDPAPFFEADEAFHATLMRIAGHERAWSVVEAAKGQHDRVRRLVMIDPLKRNTVFAEHRAIVDRFARRDLSGALAAMQHHLRAVFISVERVMAEFPDFFAAADGAPLLPKRAPAARRAPVAALPPQVAPGAG